MKPFLTSLLAIFCVVFQIRVAAQDVIPETSVIFEPGIEVTEIPKVVVPQTIDNETRLISVQARGLKKFEQLPYPNEFKNVNSYNFDNEMLWLQVDEISGSQWEWTLNMRTKAFTRYIAKCGQKEPISFMDGLNLSWVLYEKPQTHQISLCENATGNMSEPLPEDKSWLIRNAYWNKPIQPSTSPDGQWIVLFAKSKATPTYQTFVYSYNTTDKQLRQLGDFQADEVLDFWMWVGTQILFSTKMMSDSSIPSLYIADAARPKSLEFAMSLSGEPLGYKDNPPRLEYLNGGSAHNIPYQCWWDTYLIEKRQRITHDLGTMCSPEIGKLAEDAYYRDIPNVEGGRPTIATLFRYNALTGERKDLYSGEIESIEWVSEDEHYAIMTIGTNGVIDRVHDIDPEFWDLYSSPTRLAYVDLVNKKILFSVPAFWTSYWDGQALEASIQQIGENKFLGIGYTSNQDGVASIFTFDGTKYAEKQIADHVAFIIGHYLLRWTDGYQKSTRVSLYDIEIGKETPIIRSIDMSKYQIDVSTSSTSCNCFIVSISNIPNTDYLLAKYEVKIPLS